MYVVPNYHDYQGVLNIKCPNFRRIEFYVSPKNKTFLRPNLSPDQSHDLSECYCMFNLALLLM